MSKLYSVATVIGGVTFYHHKKTNPVFGEFQPSIPPLSDLFETKKSATEFIANCQGDKKKLSVVEICDFDDDAFIEKLGESFRVIFKKDGEGEIVAFFMDTIDGTEVDCCSDDGTFFKASMDYFDDCEPTEKEEILPLLKRLIDVEGYKHIKVRSPYMSFTSLEFMKG